MDLSTRYLGLRLKNPLLPSASPLSRDLDSARRLEDAGAAGIVMYSLFEEQILAEEMRYERFAEHSSLGHAEASGFLPGQPAYQSSFDAYFNQLQALKSALDIPVIASLNGVTAEGWVEYGGELAAAGADAIELNVYYIAADIRESSAAVEQRYVDVVQALRDAVHIPIAVKLSPQFSSPLHFCQQLQDAGCAAVVLFNRFYQSDINMETLEVEPQLQLSHSYESLLRVRWTAMLRGALDLDIATTGGFHESEDILKALLAGANAVQLCSTLLSHGPDRLGQLLLQIDEWLQQHEYDSVQQLQGSLSYRNASNPSAYERENYLSVLDSFTPPASVRY